MHDLIVLQPLSMTLLYANHYALSHCMLNIMHDLDIQVGVGHELKPALGPQFPLR